MTLLAAFNFDEVSGNVLDVTGNGHDFAISGNTVRTASGHTNGGLTQTATATAPGPSPSAFNTTSRTWMTWIKFAAAVNGWILEFHVTSADTGAWGLLDISGTLRFRAKNSSNTVFESTAIDRSLGNWQHIAATHDGANLKVYINGVLHSTTAMASAVWAADVLNVLDQTGTNVILDDVRFYDQALDAAAITTLMGTPVAAGGISNPVGTVGETDTALPVGRVKARALGVSVETGTAQLITRRKIRSLGTAFEADSALAVARAKQRQMLGASESDIAAAITRPAPVLGVAAELDTALPILRRKVRALGVAAEADIALAAARVKRRQISAAVEADTALVIHATKRHLVNAAAEVDQALHLGPVVALRESVLTATNAPSAVLTAGNHPSSSLEATHGV